MRGGDNVTYDYIRSWFPLVYLHFTMVPITDTNSMMTYDAKVLKSQFCQYQIVLKIMSLVSLISMAVASSTFSKRDVVVFRYDYICSLIPKFT